MIDFTKIAAQILPCDKHHVCMMLREQSGMKHLPSCAASKREALAKALQDAYEKGYNDGHLRGIDEGRTSAAMEHL